MSHRAFLFLFPLFFSFHEGDFALRTTKELKKTDIAKKLNTSYTIVVKY